MKQTSKLPGFQRFGDYEDYRIVPHVMSHGGIAYLFLEADEFTVGTRTVLDDPLGLQQVTVTTFLKRPGDRKKGLALTFLLTNEMLDATIASLVHLRDEHRAAADAAAAIAKARGR